MSRVSGADVVGKADSMPCRQGKSPAWVGIGKAVLLYESVDKRPVKEG